MTDVTKVSLFDLDDSLVDRAGTCARRAAEFPGEHGVPLSWLRETDPAYSSRRLAFFQLVKDTFDVPGTVDELHVQYRRRMPQLIQPDSQVCSALEALHVAGWQLGVVTNRMAGNRTTKLRRADLYDLVDTVVASESAGVRKPDPRIFHLALSALGAEPSPRVVMVGDSLATDVGGALAARSSAVWISNNRPCRGTDSSRTGPSPPSATPSN
ncbi:HAD family hydrolase [Streptomyces ehimensis]|uniref:HAD family hydrolase n=1 Tax=Streptomyces ehimensis TaxID=68195 RepID=A0ABV9BR26_9ACTN